MKYNFISETPCSVKEFLNRYLPLNKEKTDKLLSNGEVKINGQTAKKTDLVSCGDSISVFIPMSFGMLEPETVYFDANIIIVDKPVGYETETSLKYFLTQKYGEVYPVHRLDRNTTGLIIFARNKLAEREIETAIKNRKIRKFYLAWLHGLIERDGEAVAYLLKADNYVKIFSAPVKDAKKIITKYHVLKKQGNYTLVEVELVTGRTHQIRAHFAFLGHSVVGDSRYGNGNGYQKLRSYKIILDGLEDLNYLNGKIFQADCESFYHLELIN